MKDYISSAERMKLIKSYKYFIFQDLFYIFFIVVLFILIFLSITGVN